MFVPTGTFKLQMEFTEEYPNKPPTVRFISKMFHPNGKLSRRFLPRVVCSNFSPLYCASCWSIFRTSQSCMSKRLCEL